MDVPKRAFDPQRIFECLAKHGVEHIVIGGLAAIAQEVGWPTYDADVVVDTTVVLSCFGPGSDV